MTGKLPVKSGEVTTGSKKIVEVVITVNRPVRIDGDTAEVHVVLNGRKILTMSPPRAMRSGLVTDDEYADQV